MTPRLHVLCFFLPFFWLGGACALAQAASMPNLDPFSPGYVGRPLTAEEAASAEAKWKKLNPAVADLPRGIVGIPGQISLIADFKAVAQGQSVPVYLINLSGKDIPLQAQSGELLLKQQTRDASGQWVRSEVHEFDSCGHNGLPDSVLPNGHCRKLAGFQAAGGAEAQVRYRVYLQPGLDLISNEGPGLVEARQVQDAARDELALRSGTLEFVRSIALRHRILPEITVVTSFSELAKQDAQLVAIRALGSGRWERGQAEAVLSEVEALFPELKELVASVRSVLAGKSI